MTGAEPKILVVAESRGKVVSKRMAHRGQRLLIGLAPSRVGALYVLAAVVVIFSLWVPQQFDEVATLRQIADQNATDGLMALALVVPLAAGVYDLSVAATLGLSSIVTAQLIARTDLQLEIVILIAIAVALMVGVVNAAIVVVLRVDSFIATLATSSLISAAVLVVSGNIAVNSPKLLGPVQSFAIFQIGGLQMAVYYLLALTLIVWFLLEATAIGRKLYATGFNIETARLSGVRVNALRAGTLLFSALVAGFVGIVVTGQIGTGDPTTGPAYLLPAFAIAFVGATQITPGRFNGRGTLIATILIGTGSVGLSLAAVPEWSPQVYLGVVLIVAVSITGFERRTLRRRSHQPEDSARARPSRPDLMGKSEGRQ
jgi:ribose transport system permease protein